MSARDAARFGHALALIPLCVVIEAILIIQMQVVFRICNPSMRTPFVASWYVRWYGHAVNRFLPGICGALAYSVLRSTTASRARHFALGLLLASVVSVLANLTMFQFPGRAWGLTPPPHLDPQDVLYVLAELASILSWYLILALLLAIYPVRRAHTVITSFGVLAILAFSISELINAISMMAMSAFSGSEWPTRLYALVCDHTEWWTHFVYPIASIAWLVLFWLLVRRGIAVEAKPITCESP